MAEKHETFSVKRLAHIFYVQVTRRVLAAIPLSSQVLALEFGAIHVKCLIPYTAQYLQHTTDTNLAGQQCLWMRQVLCASPFLDACLFQYDEKLISPIIRPRALAEVRRCPPAWRLCASCHLPK